MIEIEGYTAIEQIGHGGLGDVYRATRASTGGLVAVKVLRDVSDASVAWHRTRRELTALVSLAGHANVIQLIELLELPEGPALVMEYAPGGSVADLLLHRDGPLATSEAVLIGRQTAAALVAAHEQGIVHRDVKPQNLLIDAYGQIKLCDFGIAAIARTPEFQVRTSALSMRYASPEDLDDDVEVGPPADVYSLGATLLHLVHGAPPTLKDRLAPWQAPATDDEQLTAVDRVIAACLHPDPIARPTAAVVLDELERLDRSSHDRSRALPVGGDVSSPSAAYPSVAEQPEAPPMDPATSVGALGSHDGRTAPTATVSPAAVTSARIDETVVRPGRVPPERPSPAAGGSPNRRRRAVLVATALAVVGLGVAGLALLDRGSGDGRDPADVLLVARPEGLPAITSIDWPEGDVGECHVQAGRSLSPIACDQPHDLERIAVGDLDDGAAPSGEFDEAAIDSEVRQRCGDERARLVDDVDPAVAGMVEAPFTVPTATAWASGDRRYECWIGSQGRRIVGSLTAGERADAP